MKKLRTYVVMTDRGYSDLKKSVGVMFLKKLVVLLPFFVLEALISALLDGFLNQKADMIQLGLTALTGVFVMFLMMGVFCFEYKKTNIPTYYEAERIRLVVAEKLSSVPMSYLSQKNAAEISGTLMDDCARMESFYSGLFPDFLSSLAVLPIWFMILAVLEWRLALAAFCLVPPAFMILFSTMR